MYYEVHGRDDAPAILFSHGVSMSHETFKPQAEGLQDKFRVIIWDMLNHGQSTPLNDQLPFSETTADYIVDLLDYLIIEKAVLAGLSLGSYVTQIIAHKYPERGAAENGKAVMAHLTRELMRDMVRGLPGHLQV